MGGAAKGVANTVGRVGSGVLTLGGSEIARNNLPRNNVIRNALGLPGTILTGGLAGQDQMPALFGGGDSNPYVAGPFSLDPAQLAADKAAISGEGQKEYGASTDLANKQYQQTLAAAPDLVSKQLALNNPDIMESLNATHQLTSTAYPTELARQQAQLQQALTVPALQRRQEQESSALTGLNGFGQSGVGRQLSLEDFINQANVAKTIGAQMAPQVGNGKGQTGTALAGAGSAASGLSGLLKLGGKGAGAAMGGPAGAAAGGAAGDYLGNLV